MANSSNSRAAAAGGNTTGPAAAAGRAPESDTPASAGAFHPAPKPARGATTSRRSQRSSTTDGKPEEPPPAGPVELQLPYPLIACAGWLYLESSAVEILVFDGGGRLIVGEHDVELQPGRYVLAQLNDESELLPPNVIYRVPNGAT